MQILPTFLDKSLQLDILIVNKFFLKHKSFFQSFSDVHALLRHCLFRNVFALYFLFMTMNISSVNKFTKKFSHKKTCLLKYLIHCLASSVMLFPYLS